MSLRLGGFWTIQLHVPFTGDPTRYRSDDDIDDDAKSYPFYSRYLVDVAPASLRGKHLHSSPKGVLILTEVGAVPEHKDHLMNTRDGLPLLKHWCETCCETHIECNHDSETKKFPMRLIDIMKDPPHTLCLGDTLNQDTPYVTLSHCWGSNTQVMNLQKCNLQSFLHLIPPEVLPNTFQEFFDIARYLDFRYIWIDSLCIVQDDLDDWAPE
jgi:hypothetical protein